MGNSLSPERKDSEPVGPGLLDCTRQGRGVERVCMKEKEREYTGRERKEDQVNSYICTDEIADISNKIR
jgi:hypothetical protein